MSQADYLPTIGIECHVQLKSKTKLFSAVGNDARNAAPNTLISHICVGMPGALPVLNEGALALAARAAYVLGTTPQKFSHFDRKHYFYPDLPKGYQITQYKNPIIVGGRVSFEVDGETKTVDITRAHLEEDAGKNTHPEGGNYSLVDLNRAGTPLLEIVSEPQLHNGKEAKAYARELYLLMKYSGVSDCDLYHGNMRFDVNISVSKDPAKLGIRSEIKNLNSFRSVEAAIDYEIKRQIEVLESSDHVVQETRGWDEAKQVTTPQRGKEEAHDYRYFPDPDLPPLELSEAFIKDVAAALPPLPPAIRLELTKLNLDKQVIEDVLEHTDEVPAIIEILNSAGAPAARRASFWLLETGKVDVAGDSELSKMIDAGELSTSAAKTVRELMLKNGQSPREIAESKNLIQLSDQGELESAVAKVLQENPKAVEDIKKGELKAVGFLVGQVMKTTGGKANPAAVQDIIKSKIGD